MDEELIYLLIIVVSALFLIYIGIMLAVIVSKQSKIYNLLRNQPHNYNAPVYNPQGYNNSQNFQAQPNFNTQYANPNVQGQTPQNLYK